MSDCIPTAITPDNAERSMATRTIEDDQMSVYRSLDNMRAFVFNQYTWNTPYEVQAWQYLTGDQNHGSGGNLALDIILDILTAVVAAAGVATENPMAGVAAGFISSFVKEWGIGKGGPPPDLNDAFADFGASYTAKSVAIVNRLDQLRGDLDPQTGKPTSVIKNWELEFEFGGKTYKLRDLATAEWPAIGHGKWDAMREAGMLAFKKQIWKTIISGGSCQYYEPYTSAGFVPKSDDARDKRALKAETADYYKSYPGYYVRAEWEPAYGGIDDYVPPRWIPRNWTLGPARYPFPPKACEVLFKDGIAGQIINEAGLFTRWEVFNTMALPHPDWGTTQDV